MFYLRNNWQPVKYSILNANFIAGKAACVSYVAMTSFHMGFLFFEQKFGQAHRQA